jgi:recombinational DNA repair ATPase RecF
VVFLLDDIFSELDPGRCEFLFKRIPGGCQVFAAVPRRPAFDLPEDRKEFQVENGAIREGP